jgi:hypothetical protein
MTVLSLDRAWASSSRSWTVLAKSRDGHNAWRNLAQVLWLRAASGHERPARDGVAAPLTAWITAERHQRVRPNRPCRFLDCLTSRIRPPAACANDGLLCEGSDHRLERSEPAGAPSGLRLDHFAAGTIRPATKWLSTGTRLGQMQQRHRVQPDADGRTAPSCPAGTVRGAKTLSGACVPTSRSASGPTAEKELSG